MRLPVVLGLFFLLLLYGSVTPTSAQWFSGWFGDEEEGMVKSLCKSRTSLSMPLGACCDSDGDIVSCDPSQGGDADDGDPHTPDPGDPPPNGGSNSVCYNGTGYCAWDYLKQYFNNDSLAAGRASGICQRESNSDPTAGNTTCDQPGGTMDYSLGLFQINMLAHCSSDLLNNFSKLRKQDGGPGYTGAAFNARDIFVYSGNVPRLPCEIRGAIAQQRLAQCKEAMFNPKYNTLKAAAMSSNGSNWGAWSSWDHPTIGLKQCEADNPGGGETGDPPPTMPESDIVGCPDGSTRINVPGTTYKHLNQQHYCIKPKMVVVHWNASWTSADATFNTLNARDRSCQLAVDPTTSLQMLDFYPESVQQGWCVGGSWNDVSISIEITGVYFDDLFLPDAAADGTYVLNREHPRFDFVKTETDKAIALTCWSLKQYNIPKTEIYGHYELNSGKIDAGAKYYTSYFKNRVKNECL